MSKELDRAGDMFNQDKSISNFIERGREVLSGISSYPRNDARLLLCKALDCNGPWLLANSTRTLNLEQENSFDALLTRRARHEPMQYILGEQEFYGLRFEVTPAVLIPRPETELLVEAALARLAENSPTRVLDVGTGSGAIAVSIAHARPLAQVVAVDTSPQALQIAQTNAQAHGVASRVRFFESNLLGSLRGERFEMIVSNPPYVATTEALEPQVRDWEPHAALFAGPDGLEVYRRLIPQAAEALEPGGRLLLELGHGQRQALAALLAGWHEVIFLDDLQAIPRVVCARR